MPRLSSTAWLAAGAAFLTLTAHAASTRQVRFNQDIRPILSENCFLCHGPDAGSRKADLRLDLAQDARSKVIVPGKPEESKVIQHVTHSDPDELMPPPKTGKKLTPAQIELLRRWVAEGANYEAHWSFLPVERIEPPPSSEAGRAAHPIDRFILSRLEREGLKPSPEADRRVLIRRLSLDLLGLPPTPEEVEAFVNDTSPGAFEKLVDRLLASPHYGERMAVWWLDLVRYADSVGYHGDQVVSVWPYRDYVINAFNQNLPFDRFTREQLAGDLLPDSGRPQKVASGYNRLGMMSSEGGVQDKEYRAKYAAERVRNVSGTWLGATMACAECHDHKYDPITTKDFYRMAAFFADLKEKGFYDEGFHLGNWGPSLRLATEAQQKQLDQFDADIATARKALDTVTDKELATAREQWELTAIANDAWGKLAWQNQKPIRASTANGAVLEIKDEVLTATGPNPDFETYTVELPAPLERITAVRLETLNDEALPGNRIARSGQTYMLSEVEIALRTGTNTVLRPLKVGRVLASAEPDGHPALALVDGRPDTAWAHPHHHSADHRVVFQLAEPVAGGTNVSIVVTLRHETQPRLAVGKFRLGLSSLSWMPADKSGLPDEVLKALKVAPEKRDEKQRKSIARHYRKIAPQLAEAHTRLAKLEAGRSLLLGHIPTTLVTEATTPRTMRVLPRGNWMIDSGEIVEPGVPAALKQIDTGTNRATRLDLANWLVSRENPLTARVVVNRLWKLCFGSGITKNTEDLGSQGEWPVHPALLDWLAHDFMNHGWDIKHTLRQMVTSATYQQASTGSRLLDERDPFNRLYARQSRVRLDAEFIRDNALAVSGLLVDQVGGPSVKPWQPPGLWAPLNFPKREYEPDRGPATWRRGLYTHWQRTFLHPALLAFDAPTREECTVNRPPSNTPLQALVLLNDPEYLEAARVFAERIARQPGDFGQRLRFAFNRALGRAPQAQESKTLEGLFQAQRASFEKDKTAAKALVSVGEAPLPADLDATELAAWTSVSRALLNLHETITRN